MSKKVISIVLSAAMLVAMFCVGFGAVTAAADDTFTYYFLAPDTWCNPDAGAVNTSVGAYWWSPEDKATPAWPGLEIFADPSVGPNVYKVEAPNSDETGIIIFNAFVDAGNPADPELAKVAHQTVNINVEGYEAGECEYDKDLEVADFNGWIYVLANDDEHQSVNDFSGAITSSGAWFPLDTYKNYDKFYGSYGFAADTETETDSEEPAPSEGAKYHVGDTVTVTVEAGNIAIDGAAAKLGAYNYDVNYNAEAVKYVSATDKTTGGMPLVNSAKEGVVKLATMAAMGLNEDFSGDKAPVYVLTFEVTADTDDLGINGKCTSLTAVTMDGSSTKTLVGVNNPEDPYTDLVYDVDCPHETSDTDSEEPTPSKLDDSKPESTPSENESKTESTPSKNESKTESTPSKNTSSKATGDNASSKASTSSGKSTTTSTATSTATVQTAGTFAVVSLVVILMIAAAVVLYTRKKTEE